MDKLNEDPSSVPSMFNLDCCKFYEYFSGSTETMLNIYNKVKEEKCLKYEFVGYNNKDNNLFIRFDFHDDKVLFNLPEFLVYV